MSSVPAKWLDDEEKKPAPEPLRRVQSLINTVDRESGLDRLAAAGDAAPWMTANGLLGCGDTPTEDDLLTLIEVREGLRALVVGEDGAVSLMPVGESLRARLLALLLIVSDAQRDGTWAHLLACANDDCQWAFYDRSRNHGGTWCDMATCGNKLKNRDFRARQRTDR
jgi:hypothetical protein